VKAARSDVSGSVREHELLVAAAALVTTPERAARLRGLTAEPLDWVRLWKLAQQHAIAPLVFHTLTSSHAIEAADPRIAPFRAGFFANTANSMVLARELIDLLTVFAEAGINAIPYKGAVLAASLYGNIALREFSDLDLIVTPGQVPAARAALVARGYVPEIALTSAEERALVSSRAGYFLRFDRPTRAGDVTLELHWRIPSTFAIDVSRLRLTSVALLGREVPQIATEDLFVLLCAHGVKHAWNQLKWICDIAVILERRPALDWPSLLDQATRAGARRVVLLGCAMASRTLRTPLPETLSAAIAADVVVQQLAERIAGRLFDRPMPRIGVIGNLRVRERATDKIAYCTGLVLHITRPTVREKARWPAWPGARLTYSVLQPIRLALRVAGKYRR